MVVIAVLELGVIIGLVVWIFSIRKDALEYEKLENFGCPFYICRAPYTQDGNEYRAFRTEDGANKFQESLAYNIET